MSKKSEKKCVFCEVINGERPAWVIHEDEVCVAFLDYRPVYKGHVLLVPRKHVETMMDVPDDLMGPLFQRVKLLSQAVEISLEADGIFNAVNNRMSQSVPHIHVHIIPRRKKDNMRHFLWPRKQYENDHEAEEYKKKIAEVVSKLDTESKSWDFLHELAERLSRFPDELDRSEYQQPLEDFMKHQRRSLSHMKGDHMSVSLFSSKEKVKDVLAHDKVLATLFLKEFVLK